MNDDAREKFRARYRANISPYYSGFIHVAIVLIMGGGMTWLCLAQVEGFQWPQLWIVAVTLLAYNYGEWASHRWWGHHKTKLFKLFYQRHTGDHHTFFVEHDMEYQMVLDWRVVIFPVYLLVVFTLLVTIPVGAVIYWTLGWNFAFLFAATNSFCYLAYETLHFSYHLPKGSLLERIFSLIPGWKYLRLFHTVHHNRELMTEGNFNITLPLADWLFGTLYFDANDKSKTESGREESAAV